jgi:hypothetical protein
MAYRQTKERVKIKTEEDKSEMVSSLFTHLPERNFALNKIYISKRGGCQLQNKRALKKSRISERESDFCEALLTIS